MQFVTNTHLNTMIKIVLSCTFCLFNHSTITFLQITHYNSEKKSIILFSLSDKCSEMIRTYHSFLPSDQFANMPKLWPCAIKRGSTQTFCTISSVWNTMTTCTHALVHACACVSCFLSNNVFICM